MALFAVPEQILQWKGPIMAPTKQANSGNWLQREILDKILEVKNKVDESLQLGRENGEAIRNLRTELGVDGLHGRIPQLEQAVARLDRQQEDDNKEVHRRIDEQGKKAHESTNKLLSRIEPLERGEHISQGKKQAATIAISIICSSGFATLVVWLLTHVGVIHP